MNGLKTLIIQAVVPAYRIAFFEELNRRIDFDLIAGKEYFTKSVVSADAVWNFSQVRRSTNLYFFSRFALLQLWPDMARDLFKQNVRVVELNPRCLTSWCSLICSRFFQRGRTITWGHLENRSGKFRSSSPRAQMLRLADGAIFYTRGQYDSYLLSGVSVRIAAGYAPNAVLNSLDITPVTEIGTDFAYVGRLTAAKKPLLLLSAFDFACSAGLEGCLHFVGSGELQDQLTSAVAASPNCERIFLHGARNETEFLRDIYSRSVCAVSPGYVGLALTQALAFGRPVLIAKDEPHAPEIEIFVGGSTGDYFASDDPSSLAQLMLRYSAERRAWSKHAERISSKVRDEYSIEAMARGYCAVVEKLTSHG